MSCIEATGILLKQPDGQGIRVFTKIHPNHLVEMMLEQPSQHFGPSIGTQVAPIQMGKEILGQFGLEKREDTRIGVATQIAPIDGTVKPMGFKLVFKDIQGFFLGIAAQGEPIGVRLIQAFFF